MTPEQIASIAERDRAERELAKATEKGEAFKRYVHQRLDAAGVPADPEPKGNALHGCRIEGRLNYVLDEHRHVLHERARDIEALERVAAKLTEAQAQVLALRRALDTAIDQMPATTERMEIGRLLATKPDDTALRAFGRRCVGRAWGRPGDIRATAVVDAELRGDP